MIKKQTIAQKGFTLIELLIVIAIFTLITSIVMANYKKFGSQMALRNTTYDMALTVREAQVYGISGRFQDKDDFSPKPIIIMFDKNAQTDGNSLTHTFIMFRDVNGDNRQTNINENIANFDLKNGFVIDDIIAEPGNVSLSKVSIKFQRPEPDATIYDDSGQQYSAVRIIVKSVRNKKMSVYVESAGQISVQKVNQ